MPPALFLPIGWGQPCCGWRLRAGTWGQRWRPPSSSQSRPGGGGMLGGGRAPLNTNARWCSGLNSSSSAALSHASTWGKDSFARPAHRYRRNPRGVRFRVKTLTRLEAKIWEGLTCQPHFPPTCLFHPPPHFIYLYSFSCSHSFLPP